MTWFDVFTLLQSVLPPILIFLTAYLLIRSFLRNDTRRREQESDRQNASKLLELKMQNRKDLTPIRLQAYERLLLFVERNRIPALYLRIRKANMTAQGLQVAMLKSVREEFDHNLSQQLYVSGEAWKLLVSAKDNTLDLIASAQPAESEDALAYGSRLIDIYAAFLDERLNQACSLLVKEVELIFN
jgi:hypothetical protein